MARTFRRTRFVDRYVTREYVYLGGYVRLDGEDLKRALVKWHRDRKRSHIYNPSKEFRLIHERSNRARARQELHRFQVNPDYEVALLDKPPLPYWD